MPKALLIFLFSICFKISIAQFYDKALAGRGGTMVKLNFNGNTIDTSSFYWGTAQVEMDGASSNVSDTSGNILFYSNGVKIGNRLSQIMDGGENLTDSLFYNYCKAEIWSLRPILFSLNQAILFMLFTILYLTHYLL